MPTQASASFVEITSPQNPRYKAWLKLLDAKKIKRSEEALLAGKKVLEEVLLQYPSRVNGIITRHPDEARVLPIPSARPVYIVAPELFATLDIYGTKSPLLLISAPPLPVWDGTLEEGLTVFLPFQNPINLGTTLRTAAALHSSVVLLQEAATPYLPKSLRASGPAVFQIPLFRGPSLADLAKNYAHLPLYALSPKGEDIRCTSFTKTMGLVAGMEGPGLDEFWPLEKRLSIPMNPEVESLNAAIAMAMAMAIRLALLK